MALTRESVASAIGAIALFSLATVFNKLLGIPVIDTVLMSCGAICMILLALFLAKEIVTKPLINDIQRTVKPLMNDVQRNITKLVIDEVRWNRIAPLLLNYEEFSSEWIPEITNEEGEVSEKKMKEHFKKKQEAMRQKISVALRLMAMLRKIYEEERIKMEREQAHMSSKNRIKAEAEDVRRELEELMEIIEKEEHSA